MSPWKKLALSLYYYGTLPRRRCVNARAASLGRTPIIVLFYHRVADDDFNEWTISNRQFARHIDWLRTRFELISLEEVQRRLRLGRNNRPAVSITFDDGYDENCHRALPLLIRESIPCTYFVTTHNVLENEPFPHDVARGRPLPPNSLQQLRALAAAGIEIGAHSRRHVDLGRISGRRRLAEEVVDARDELSAAIGRPVRYFAFPFGQHRNLNAEVFQLAKRAGYAGVCSAYGGYNDPGDDPFHLQRFHGDPELMRLQNWLTVDSRQRRRVARFNYQTGTVSGPPRGPRSADDPAFSFTQQFDALRASARLPGGKT
jgi:peptidoglycan/xylan/chitin deacetylase (PgdA/CDA1 family)